MSSKDVRWRQRFEQFNKAFQLLRKSLQIETPSEVERAGIIQFFEMTFELSWRLLKDFLEAEGFETRSPRAALKKAYEVGIIENGHHWMDALDDRNLTVHTYNEALAKKVEELIRNKYFILLNQLHVQLEKEQ